MLQGQAGLEFQSTLPHGERHRRRLFLCLKQKFQSTLPAGGATCTSQAVNFPTVQFQSTLPAGGATYFLWSIWIRRHISIHAPRRGERQISEPTRLPSASFQSTLPAGGATFVWYNEKERISYFNPRSPQGERHAVVRHIFVYRISIHAPRRGSDLGLP